MRNPTNVLRAAAFVLASAVALAIVPGVPAQGAPAQGAPADVVADPGVRWSRVLSGGPWGVAADRVGAVVVGDDGTVSAVSPSGRVGWRARDVDVTEAAPALSADSVLVGGEQRATLLARADGAVRWHVPAAGNVASLALGGGLAIVGDDAGTLRALDVASGAARWTVSRPGRLFSGARIDLGTGAGAATRAGAGTVVASWHGGPSPHVEALDLATGATRWSVATGPGAAAPTVGGGVVVLAVGDGSYHARVEARDLATGEARWSTTVPASFEEAIEPAIGAGEVVVVDHFGIVTSLGLDRGDRRWTRPLGEPVLAGRVSLGDHRVVLTTYGGAVVTIRRSDGQVLAHAEAKQLGGIPLGGVLVAWPGHSGYLTGLRLTEPGALVLLRVR
jgi:outer membrane protein assembly factor BamB